MKDLRNNSNLGQLKDTKQCDSFRDKVNVIVRFKVNPKIKTWTKERQENLKKKEKGIEEKNIRNHVVHQMVETK